MNLRLERVDHRDPSIAEALATLRRAAYAVEAAWLGAVDFPPARIRAEDVAREDAEVFGAYDAGALAGALSIEPTRGDARLVASLVVAPERHRRGIARALVAYAIGRYGSDPLVVSTGVANVAALALYREFGFVETLRRRVGQEPIDVVELRREGMPAPVTLTRRKPPNPADCRRLSPAVAFHPALPSWPRASPSAPAGGAVNTRKGFPPMNIRTIAIGFIVVMAFVGGIVWQNQMQKSQQEQAPMAQQQQGGDMGAMGDGSNPHANGGMPGMPAAEAPHPGIEWTTPKGWQDLGARSMRVATYGVPKVGGDAEDAECAVFYFGQGQGGGVDENIDRWIGQFENPGQPERSKFDVGSFKVHRVAVNGTYTAPGGMSMEPTANKSAYRLVGAIVEGPQGSVFFKLTGPEKTTRGAEKDFDAMLKSLHP